VSPVALIGSPPVLVRSGDCQALAVELWLAHAAAGFGTRRWCLVKRVSVVGNSGSGKSCLSARVAAILDVPHVELDAIHHLPGWEAIDPEKFQAQIAATTATDGWVIDGNYRSVVIDGPVWRRADTVVWLDLPRRTVMYQVTRRTLRRLIRRERLWNGNRESWRSLWTWDPDRSIIRWAWTQHASYQQRYRSAMESPALQHLEFVRLRSHDVAEQWLERLDQSNPR
jgi:adenylate kinase family enzyme